MSANFINVDRDTSMLLPPDLRDWIPENDLVHFIIDAVDSLDLQGFSVISQFVFLSHWSCEPSSLVEIISIILSFLYIFLEKLQLPYFTFYIHTLQDVVGGKSKFLSFLLFLSIMSIKASKKLRLT